MKKAAARPKFEPDDLLNDGELAAIWASHDSTFAVEEEKPHLGRPALDRDFTPKSNGTFSPTF